jgi:hypothetical protein
MSLIHSKVGLGGAVLVHRGDDINIGWFSFCEIGLYSCCLFAPLLKVFHIAEKLGNRFPGKLALLHFHLNNVEL